MKDAKQHDLYQRLRHAAEHRRNCEAKDATDEERLAAEPFPGTPSFALIVTRGHRHDALVLKDWIHKPFLFLGMIGSARKARTILDHFREEKIATPEQMNRVACPVGIPIKSRTVQEIAVSIMAQFIEKRAELVNDQAGSPAARAELV